MGTSLRRLGAEQASTTGEDGPEGPEGHSLPQYFNSSRAIKLRNTEQTPSELFQKFDIHDMYSDSGRWKNALGPTNSEGICFCAPALRDDLRSYKRDLFSVVAGSDVRLVFQIDTERKVVATMDRDHKSSIREHFCINMYPIDHSRINVYFIVYGPYKVLVSQIWAGFGCAISRPSRTAGESVRMGPANAVAPWKPRVTSERYMAVLYV